MNQKPKTSAQAADDMNEAIDNAVKRAAMKEKLKKLALIGGVAIAAAGTVAIVVVKMRNCDAPAITDSIQ